MKQNIEINVNVSHPVKEEPIETVETAFASTKVTGKKTQNASLSMCRWSTICRYCS